LNEIPTEVLHNQENDENFSENKEEKTTLESVQEAEEWAE